MKSMGTSKENTKKNSYCNQYRKRGNIQYFEPEEILFGKEDIWDEPGKDKRKVKKLERVFEGY